MQLLDGKKIADKIFEDLAKKVKGLQSHYINPTLAIILVGNDASSVLYTSIKKKKAESIGIKVKIHRLSGRVTEKTILELIEKLNKDKKVTGILVQMPIPDRISRDKVVWAIAPDKDVDGFQMRKFMPPAPLAILSILNHYGINLTRKKMLIIGQGFLIGKPLSTMALKQGARVISADSSTAHLKRLIQDVEIIVSATGQPKLVKSDMVKPGQIVIDAGGGKIGGEFVGDVDFESVKEIVEAITPNPGGIGPLTVALLAKNIVQSAAMTKVSYH